MNDSGISAASSSVSLVQYPASRQSGQRRHAHHRTGRDQHRARVEVPLPALARSHGDAQAFPFGSRQPAGPAHQLKSPVLKLPPPIIREVARSTPLAIPDESRVRLPAPERRCQTPPRAGPRASDWPIRSASCSACSRAECTARPSSSAPSTTATSSGPDPCAVRAAA